MWKGKSKHGCNRCKYVNFCGSLKVSNKLSRSKHLKCDELRPCIRCVKPGATCDLPLAVSADPDHGPLESEIFHYFATQLAPNRAGLPGRESWIRSVCPIAQSKKDVFNAILVTATI